MVLHNSGQLMTVFDSLGKFEHICMNFTRFRQFQANCLYALDSFKQVLHDFWALDSLKKNFKVYLLWTVLSKFSMISKLFIVLFRLCVFSNQP